MWKYVLVLLTLTSVAAAQDGYEIKGHVNLDDSWNPVIYLSLIEAFDELTTISGEMIIGQAKISANGDFTFQGNYIPLGDRVYRVHVCKKGDPISTIIIGGREHNHIHFAMKPGDLITLESKAGQVFGDVEVTGNPVNELLISTNEIINRGRASAVKSTLGVRLNGEEIANELMELIASSDYPLGKFYASFYLLDRFENTVAVEKIREYVVIPSMSDSPYYDELVELIEYKVPQEEHDPMDTDTRLLGVLFVIPVAFILGWLFINKDKQNEKIDPLRDLSVQERKVLSLLATGLSNKEISSELNIGVSTVKSHVHKIYKKLKISSRKDVYQFSSHLSASGNPENAMTEAVTSKH